MPQDRIKEILKKGDASELRTLFAFDNSNSEQAIAFKFKAWAYYFFPHYFSSPDAPFHKDTDIKTIEAYRGLIESFVDIAFRGAAKTARKRLFLAFAIANDLDHSRRYIEILSANLDNSQQSVVDVYNMLVSDRVRAVYPEVFAKSNLKREETMSSFTTATGIKVMADTVGVSQRGAFQDGARPDLIWFDDFEDNTTLRSAVKTQAIWGSMEEARTGLAKGGSCIYTCNYTSEAGNVHRLVTKKDERNIVSIVPIEDDQGNPTWVRYTKEEIQSMRERDEDFEGERLCKPSTRKNVYFDRDALDLQTPSKSLKTSAGLRIYREFDPSKLYASGHDVSGGVGLDSSTSIFLEFGGNKVHVAAVYDDNTIKPDLFGDEISRQSQMFGGSLTAIEQNNHGHATIARAKQLDVKLYGTQRSLVRVDDVESKEYGWKATWSSVNNAMSELARAVKNDELVIHDERLLQELKSFTRDDSMDKPLDPRLTTRHFDLLRALAIAWQMRGEVTYDDLEGTIEDYAIYRSTFN